MASTNSSNFPFMTDYAKSSRSTCKTSKSSISKGTLRIAVMKKSRHFDGFEPNWSKASAFFASKKTVNNRPSSTDEIGGFDDLRPVDQVRIENYILKYRPYAKRTDAKKIAEVKAVRDQANIVWAIRDCTTKKPTELPIAAVKSVLEANKIPVIKGTSPVDLVRMLAESIVFGVGPLGKKEDGCCASKPLHFSTYYCCYVCEAALAWGPCPYSQGVEDTKCTSIQIPDEVNTDHSTWYDAVKDALSLQGGPIPPQTRLFVTGKKLPTPPHLLPKNKRSSSNPMKIKQVRKGTAKLHLSRARVDPDSGQDATYHVLDEAYDALKNSKPSAGASTSTTTAAAMPDKKESFAVELYDTMLCMTDLSTGTNSQYRLQILIPDNEPQPTHCYLWRVWGRVAGTGGGGNKLDRYDAVQDAKSEFEKLYLKYTGNKWADRKSFVKHPGKFFQLDVSHEDEKKPATSTPSASSNQLLIGDSTSRLSMRLHPVIASIFDKGIAAKQLLRVNFDVSKMPLGNMTEAQLRDAYSVLAEIEKILNPQSAAGSASPSGASAASMSDVMKKGKLQQLSNQFYSKCPSTDPKMIDTMSVLKEKVEMVDELINLQASDAAMKTDAEAPKAKSPMDVAYDKLKTELAPLDPHGDEYKLLKTYVENTRNASAPGVSGWGGNNWGSRGLRLLDAFAVQREGEASRFEPSKKLGNRRLLWHGSRISNYSGILSQGLRIAPPEAPMSGYRFGKGIYFADMLGKSANYCRTDGSSEMLVMACDVSLGKVFETPRDMYMDKAQPGSHSTHALSDIIPDPKTYEDIPDDPKQQHTMSDTDVVKVPLGKPTKSSLASRPSCDVSEFIVYDIGQVNIRYLLRLTTDKTTVAADGNLCSPVLSGSPAGTTGATKRAATAASTAQSGGNAAQPSAKRLKTSGSAFIKLESEDRSLPSASGLAVLNSRTFVEGLRLTVVKGDIAASKTEAIVVPTDTGLSLSGMVGERVKAVAGVNLQAEVNLLRASQTGAPTPAPTPAPALANANANAATNNNGGLPLNFRKFLAPSVTKTFRDIAAMANQPYITPYYCVQKKENISATKDLLCLESDGTFHRGNDARTFLGIGCGKKETIAPAQFPAGAQVFVQSSSHNRKIPPNSFIVLEISSAPPAVAAPPPSPPASTSTISQTLGTSDVCMTGGHSLPADHIIFVVSPTQSQANGANGSKEAIKKAVMNVLKKAASQNFANVALPSIGSGRAGLDKGETAAWIIGAIAEYLEEASTAPATNQTIKEVCFCLYDDESLDAYRQGILAQEQAV